MTARKKPPLELAGRALCEFRGLLPDSRFNGAPIWHSTAYEAMVVMEVVLSREQLLDMIPGYPFPDLHDPKRKPGD